MEYINLDFVIPNKDCNDCDHHNDYTCFHCEDLQVRKKYPNSKYTDDCNWVIESEVKYQTSNYDSWYGLDKEFIFLDKLDTNLKTKGK